MGIKRWHLLAVVPVLAWCHYRESAEHQASETTPGTLSPTFAAARELLNNPAQFKAHPSFVPHGALRLEGQTVDDRKQPIGGVTITLNGKAKTTSEADGSFAFTDLAEGDYELVAEKGVLYASDTTTLTPSSDPDELSLSPATSAHLRVIDQHHAPIAHAHITIQRDELYTDDHGELVARGVSLSAVRLEVAADGFAPQRIYLDTGDDPHRVIEKTIMLVPGAPISGTVVDQDGHPVPKASVTLEQSHWRDSVDADDTGRWTMPFVGAGNVRIKASGDGFLADDGMTIANGAQGTRGVVVKIQVGAIARGTVVDDHGAPVVRAMVTVGDSTDYSDDKGHFNVVGIKPGIVDVVATSETGVALPQKREVVIGRPLDLQLVIVASSISGIVRDHHGDPVADVMIQAKRVGVEDQNVNGWSGDDGHFDLGGVIPGEYELVAQHRDDKTAMPEHSGIVVKSGNHDVRLVLPALGSVTGHVADHGTPITYFGVGFTQDPDERISADPVREDTGAFTIHDLPPGRFTIVLVGPTFGRTVLRNVNVTEDHETDLGTIQVERGRVIHGTVRDPSGRPVAGAKVLATTRLDDGDTIADIGRGTRAATSDANGAYEIVGLDPTEHGLTLRASLGDDRSKDVDIDDHDTIDLVIAATGSIAGHLTNMRSVVESVRVFGNNSAFYAEVDATGAFSFEHIPPGDYVIGFSYSDTVIQDQNIHVDAGATAMVTFELPQTPVAVTITSPGCKDIWLRETKDRMLLTRQECKDGVATFPDVTPNPYFACDDHQDHGEESCEPFTLTDHSIQIQIQQNQTPEDPEPPAEVVDEPEAPEDP
ncbi:MAG: carboxypeptidase regulatory-like domain-containing protein [Kofleriaceae bacterium]